MSRTSWYTAWIVLYRSRSRHHNLLFVFICSSWWPDGLALLLLMWLLFILPILDISLFPAISKVYEKAAYNQLYDYFQKHKLFYFSQYGFRKAHSTELACLELVDRVLVRLMRPFNSSFYRPLKSIWYFRPPYSFRKISPLRHPRFLTFLVPKLPFKS